MKAIPIAHSQAFLGEGPVWWEQKQAFLWVNIIDGELHLFHWSTQKDEVIYKTDGALSFVGLTTDPSTLIISVNRELQLLDIDSKKAHYLLRVEENKEDNRFNDGKPTPDGKLLVGTMSNEVTPKAGALYQVSKEGTCTTLLSNRTISNGLTWSLDQKVLYYIDTVTQQVWAFDYYQGKISNQRVVVEVPIEKGSPDGMTIDSEGNLWIAHWGGSAVRAYNPSNGKCIETVKLPVPHVSSVAFGGPDLNYLFITTARQGLSTQDLLKYPDSGNLFGLETPFKGVQPFKYIV